MAVWATSRTVGVHPFFHVLPPLVLVMATRPRNPVPGHKGEV